MDDTISTTVCSNFSTPVCTVCLESRGGFIPLSRPRTVDFNKLQHKGRRLVPQQGLLLGVDVGDCRVALEERDVRVQGALDQVAQLVALENGDRPGQGK